MRLVYTICYSLGFALLGPVFLYQMWKRGKYKENFLQRFGRYVPEMFRRLGAKNERRCWVQAVSVGEANLAFTFIAALRKRFPDLRIILTTTTSTGYALAKQKLPEEVDLLYFPQDFPFAVRRAYNLIQPDFIVLMESELWPNHIWEAARRHVPVFLANARMSPRSAARHARFRWPFCHVWPCLRLVCVQSQPDFDHYLAAGVPRGKLRLTGNLKFDASLPQPGERAALPRAGGGRPVLVAGSTWPGEEEILFDILQAVPNLFLVLVPRHVERTPEILELAKRKGVAVALRNGEPSSGGDCLLVNTTGELKSFYEMATVIFVGKSLAGNAGGQNIVEAAASGHPVLFGPHMENFKEISRQFVEAGAGAQVADAEALRRTVAELLGDAARRGRMTAAARQVIAANAGATERTVELIAAALTE
jgi:3-deoxy-D-manno-octulosonic-acid transferase